MDPDLLFILADSDRFKTKHYRERKKSQQQHFIYKIKLWANLSNFLVCTRYILSALSSNLVPRIRIQVLG